MGVKAKIGAIDLAGTELVRLGLVDRYSNFAEDGACIPAVYEQITNIDTYERHKANVISLTIGGNDNSFAAMERRRHLGAATSYERSMIVIKARHDALVAWLLRQFPNSVLIVNNSYDVTDGLGKLPNCGSWTPIVDEYSRGRRELGDHLRAVYGGDIKWKRVIFHDIFKHFDGRGFKSGNVYKDGLYYKDFLIEPGHVGAQEIAGLWVQSVIDLCKDSQEENHILSFSH